VRPEGPFCIAGISGGSEPDPAQQAPRNIAETTRCVSFGKGAPSLDDAAWDVFGTGMLRGRSVARRFVCLASFTGTPPGPTPAGWQSYCYHHRGSICIEAEFQAFYTSGDSWQHPGAQRLAAAKTPPDAGITARGRLDCRCDSRSPGTGVYCRKVPF
jgi:hypothetical protein